MIYRVLLSAGLILLGYHVGREMGRSEHIRRELQRQRRGPDRDHRAKPP